MRILFILGHNRLTGVNTWALTLAKQFIKRNHEAEIEISNKEYNGFYFLPDYKEYYSLLSHNGIKYYLNENVNYDSYDVIFVSYFVHASKINGYKGKKIYVLHGMPNRFDELYKVPEGFYKVAVSQFLKEWWMCDTFITHGVDLDFFQPADSPVLNYIPKKALCITRFVTEHTIIQALQKLDIEIQLASTETPDTLVKSIYDCDFVVAYGRSCYEAMACGKPVFVAGNNGVDGWVTTYTLPIFLYKNCSGYLNRIGIEALDKVVEQIKVGYNPAFGPNNKMLAEKYFSAGMMCERYIRVIEDYGKSI